MQNLKKHTVKSLRVQETYYEIWRGLDLASSMLSMIGLAIAIYAVKIKIYIINIA